MNLNIHQKHCKSSRVHKLRLQAARAQSKNRAAEIVKNSFRPIFGFYPDNHIDELRERSFRLLETHGVAIEHEEAVKLLTAAGATQTSDGKCYRPPRQLIKEALATTPKTVELCAQRRRYRTHHHAWGHRHGGSRDSRHGGHGAPVWSQHTGNRHAPDILPGYAHRALSTV